MEMLGAADPHGSGLYHAEILPALNKYALGYRVNTAKRIAHFLSQVATESNFRNIEEQLSYSAQRMKQIFGCKPAPRGVRSRRYTEANGDVICVFGRLRERLWTQTQYFVHNAEHLANYVYGGRHGNGPESTGDGYKYRGRGLIQTTFKDNYKIFTDEHNKRFPGDRRDFVKNPHLIMEFLEYGIESAFVYWTITGAVNSTADTGDVRAVTQAVNGGENGYPERKDAYNRLASILNLDPDGV